MISNIIKIVGTDSGLLLLDRSGQGEVFTLIKGRRFSQIEVDDRFVPFRQIFREGCFSCYYQLISELIVIIG